MCQQWQSLMMVRLHSVMADDSQFRERVQLAALWLQFIKATVIAQSSFHLCSYYSCVSHCTAIYPVYEQWCDNWSHRTLFCRKNNVTMSGYKSCRYVSVRKAESLLSNSEFCGISGGIQRQQVNQDDMHACIQMYCAYLKIFSFCLSSHLLSCLSHPVFMA